jgi:serine/threonine protein kinase
LFYFRLKWLYERLCAQVTEENALAFRAEILLTATLKHANIVGFVGACWSRELVALLLEWVPKGSLEDLLGQTSLNLAWNDPLLRLASDVARGMAYLHSRSYFDEHESKMKSCILHRLVLCAFVHNLRYSNLNPLTLSHLLFTLHSVS